LGVKSPILANDFKSLWAETKSDVLAAVNSVGESGWYILGKQVSSFERQLALFWRLGHAVGVGNGMDALEIGLRIQEIKPGDKVLTTPLSAFASTLAILRAGGVPVFVDVDENGNLDLDLARQAIEKESIRFLLPVHLYGNPLNLNELEELKKLRNLQIVEDCAQSIGAKWREEPVGTVGQVAATSFYPTKNLGALGDGGALLTNEASLAELAACYRDYGQKNKYVHSHLGLNSRLDELQAAILEQSMLPRLGEWLQKRRTIAEYYIGKIKTPYLRVLNLAEQAQSAWHLFPVFVQTAQQRESFLSHLKANNIGAAVHYPFIIPEQEALSKVDFLIYGNLLQAKKIAETEVSLPIHPYLTQEDVHYIAEVCNEWVPRNE
jgi:dTDP-4-amino-4,6-dideoxygalactose transaminase